MSVSGPMNPARILVIDDNEAIHQDFRKILGAGNARPAPTAAELALFGPQAGETLAPAVFIDVAIQGEEGRDRVARAREEGRPYAVAFIDMRMPPGWDGVETTLRIWEADPDIQVVICTAYSDYSWAEMLAKLGRSDRLVILKKPFDPIEVMQLASALAEKWRLGRQSRAVLEDLEARVAQRTGELARVAATLHDSEAQYRLLFDGNPNPMWVYDLETLRFVLVNGAAVARYGYSREEFLAMTLKDIRRPEDAGERAMGPIPTSGRSFREVRHCARDGTVLEVEISSDETVFDGRRARLVLAHDVTQRKRGEDRVKRMNRVYAVLSGINTLIVRAVDRDELFREACEIAVKEGLFRMAWIGVVNGATGALDAIASAGDVSGFFDAGRAAALGSAEGGLGLSGRAIRAGRALVSNEIASDPLVVLKDRLAERGIVSMASIPLVVGGKPMGALVLYSGEVGFFDEEEMRLLGELAGDISFAVDHIGKQELLNYLALHDVLTGLGNRVQLRERLAQWMRSASAAGHKLALYVLDVERFKNINDSLGQAAGDSLLRQVAEWLTQATGDESLVARVGPDQFAVVIPEVRHEEDVARGLEKTLKDFLDHSFHLAGNTFRVAAKAGVALHPDDGADADILFKNAEAALKKAKAKGDRYLFYAQKMTDMVSERLTLETQLRRALQQKEFVLHYQPKMSLATGGLTGVEALIRWNDPASGLVPPARFIPVLEETGLIHEVGRWALGQAIEDHLRWRDAGYPPMRIAVNVSPLQLRARGFVAEVERAIAVDPLAAAGLELEITESVIMDDVEHNIATLEAIRALGVTVAIDDFGTGFSSLSYLAKLPVDKLKVDRSFVVEMTEGPQGLALVSTIIILAHSLKLTVVAEGVETEDQSRLLRLLDCDEMQGYLFSRPVPAPDIEAMLMAQTTLPVVNEMTEIAAVA
jgi:diguanylate cyclase (GGDEF)-like protein/PAS domain S-box-containing protein